MTEKCVWPGAAALSDFRLLKLLERLRARVPRVRQVAARYLHAAEFYAPVTASNEQMLRTLLDDGLESCQDLPDAQILVVPRTGTISPWSSKATDIVRNCGLTSVRRVERGVSFSCAMDQPPTREDLMAMASLLHDQMTESVFGALTDGELGTAIFQTNKPGLLRRVPYNGRGRWRWNGQILKWVWHFRAKR